MDTFTHAISGAVIGIATGRRRESRDLRRRALWGALFAAFPDSDSILLLLTDHFTYLNAHRGVTHSIVLLPLWAAALGWLASRVNRERWRDMAMLAAAALAAHILGDLITSYGTRVFAPINNVPLAFPITFIIDPYFTGILLLGLLLALWRSRPVFGVAAGVVLAAYLLLQSGMHMQALNVGHARAAELDRPDAPVAVFPQPLSPFNWMVVVVDGSDYYRSYVNLIASEAPPRPGADAGLFRRLRAAYRPVDDLYWQRYPRWPAEDDHFELAFEAWQQAELAGFRRFALLPYVTGMRGDQREVCVWFADLRFTLHGVPHPFEYAMCRDHQGRWQLELERAREDYEP